MQISSALQTLPPMIPGIAGKAITGYQMFVIATSYFSEINEGTRIQYSKFASKINAITDNADSTWSSQMGMMVIYTPAMIASILLLALDSSNLLMASPKQSPAAVLCSIHFIKRVLEVLFLHRYSGRVEKAIPTAIGVYYSMIALLVGFVSNPTPSAKAFQLGTALFVIGISGNFYHHFLLASLRKSGEKINDKRYVVPTGGLFNYVAAPHYFFELIGWLGIAIVSSHLNVFLVFMSMTSYLLGRSVSQNEFNKKKFVDEWPADRKNLVPFIF